MNGSTSCYCHNCGEEIRSVAICPHCQTENIFLDREEWPFPPHTRVAAASPPSTAWPSGGRALPGETGLEDDAEDALIDDATETLGPAESAADNRTETMDRKAKRGPAEIVATLLLKEGSEEDVQKFDVKAGKTIVGREKAHLVLKSKKISRRHGLFVTREARVFFADNDSHNGTRINGGEDLLPKKAYALSDRDEIEFGDVKYLVRVRGPVEESDDAGESDPIEPTRRA